MKGTTPTIHCDFDEGFCSAWDVDHYATCASSVGSTRITETERTPGWLSFPRSDEDYCPEHAAQHPDNHRATTPTPPTTAPREDER